MKTAKRNSVPVTAQMLHELQDETKNGFKKFDARFKRVDARLRQVDARFDKVDARFDSMDARFDNMDAKFDELKHEIKADIHRLGLLIEEQNARNVFVLDGLTSLFNRQDRIEQKVSKL
jgi:hypothetical protein